MMGHCGPVRPLGDKNNTGSHLLLHDSSHPTAQWEEENIGVGQWTKLTPEPLSPAEKQRRHPLPQELGIQRAPRVLLGCPSTCSQLQHRPLQDRGFSCLHYGGDGTVPSLQSTPCRAYTCLQKTFTVDSKTHQAGGQDLASGSCVRFFHQFSHCHLIPSWNPHTHLPQGWRGLLFPHSASWRGLVTSGDLGSPARPGFRAKQSPGSPGSQTPNQDCGGWPGHSWLSCHL